MRQLFMCVLSLSLSGALTGLVLLLIRPLTGKCFSKKWNYYIWLLLIARLLLPVHFGISDGLWQAGNEPLAGKTEAQKEMVSSVDLGDEKEAEAGQTGDLSTVPEASVKADTAITAGPSALQKLGRYPDFGDTVTVLAVIWFAGAGICFAIKITNYMRFNRRIRYESKDVSDEQLLMGLADMCRRLHIKRQPVLRESALVSGPITIGLLKPAVILPAVNSRGQRAGWLSQETTPLQSNRIADLEGGEDYNSLTLILHHELIHIKRRDLWYKWLYQLLLCIHWFNPVLYLAAGMLNRDCELSCDEEVLGILTRDGKRAYGNLLISVAERDLCARSSVVYTTLLERKEDLRDRLRGILQYKKQSGSRKAIAFCVSLGLLLLSACGSIQAEPEAMPIRLSGDGAEEDVTGAFLSEDKGRDSQKIDSNEREEFSWVSFWGSLTERLFDYDVDDFLSGPMIVNKNGKAWKAYDDDELLAGKDISGQHSAFIYSGGGNRVSCSGLKLNGTESVRIVTVEEETELQIESSFELIEGRFKIIHVDPEGQVAVVNETGESSSGSITLKKGRNAIKMAGQGAKVRKLEIRYQGLGIAGAQNVYYSETEEYADQVLDEIKDGEVNKEELFDALIYMEEENASEAFRLLLEQEVSLSTEEIYEFLLYSDSERSGRYLVEAVREGKYNFTDEKFLSDVIPYLDEEEAGELLMALVERGYTMTYAQFTEISPYLSERTIAKIDEKMEEKNIE